MRASWLVAATCALLAAFVIVVIRNSGEPADEVQPIAWGRQPCAHCQMLIDQPGHAAQLVTGEGEVMSFDDPGCALRYLGRHHPTIHVLWFHHAHDDRWIPADRVAFVTGARTPMDSGLAAVDLGTPGAIDLATARAREVTR